MLHLDTGSGTPFYLQLYEQLKQGICSGALPKGSRLTATRALARELGVSRNTVENAYAQLVSEGYATSLVGSGFVVNGDILGAEPPASPAPRQPVGESATAPGGAFLYDFRCDSFDSSIFPLQQWRKLAADVLSGPDFSRSDIYRNTKGDPGLRGELAGYLYRSRGILCGPKDIVISNGMRPALDALLTVPLPGEALIAMEDPGFHGIRAVIRNRNFQIWPIPVRADGMDLRALAASPARIAHVTPSRQYPTGAVMPLANRRELLRWAAERDGLILEDDYDSEFRFSGRPVPSLLALDGQARKEQARNEQGQADGPGRVVYFGSFSKSLSPGMRIGYMVMPGWLRERYETVFAGFPCSVPWVEQAVLARFIREGFWERHLRRASQFIKKQHDALVDALVRHMGDTVVIHGRGAGTHILLEFPGGGSEGELIGKAGEEGVKVYPTSHFWRDADPNRPACLMLGYGLLRETDMADAVERLKNAWFPDR